MIILRRLKVPIIPWRDHFVIMVMIIGDEVIQLIDSSLAEHEFVKLYIFYYVF